MSEWWKRIEEGESEHPAEIDEIILKAAFPAKQSQFHKHLLQFFTVQMEIKATLEEKVGINRCGSFLKFTQGLLGHVTSALCRPTVSADSHGWMRSSRRKHLKRQKAFFTVIYSCSALGSFPAVPHIYPHLNKNAHKQTLKLTFFNISLIFCIFSFTLVSIVSTVKYPEAKRMSPMHFKSGKQLRENVL